MRPWLRPERERTRPRPINFFEAEARHVREQLSVCVSVKTKILAFIT